MKTLFKIYLDNLEENRVTSVEFGLPDEEEKLEMFKLRYEVYVSEKKYIPKEIADNKNMLDIDEHDRLDQCKYFIAKYKDTIIGTARLIITNPLPAEKDYFDFAIPPRIKSLGDAKLAEIGRIISRPQRLKKENFPRSIVMLGLFQAMAIYGIDNKILGGYGAIKEKAYDKFCKLSIPIYKIKKASLKVSPESTDPLTRKFFSKDDPVVMTYFITNKVKKYFDIILNHSKLFKKHSDGYLFTNKKLNLVDKLILATKLKLL